MRKSERGFTLVELLASLGILAMLLGCMMVAQSTHLHALSAAQRETFAQRALASRLDRLMAKPATLREGTHDFVLDEETRAALPTATVSETVTVRDDGTWSVVAELTWEAAGGERHATTLTTLIAAKVER